MSSRFPVYQIDFTAVAAGKRVAATKRRIRWRFGFPNKEALAEGRTGTDCRGEEHEIVIVWSVTSGKRQILMDGKEIHYSATRTGIIDHSWSSKGNHVMKIMAHAAPPMSANPGFRQYDLFIDGQSFFTMPKVYELGVRGSGDRMPGRNDYGEYSSPRSVASGNIRAPTSREQEEAELQRAINASLEQSRDHLERRGVEDFASQAPAPTSRSQEVDLFDVGAPPTPAAPQGPPTPSDARSVSSYMSAPTQIVPASTYSPTATALAPYPGAPSSQQQPYPGAPPPPQPQQAYPGAPPSQAPPPAASYPENPPAQPPTPYAAAPYTATPPPPVPSGNLLGGATASAPATAPNAYASEFAPAMNAPDDPFAPKPPTHSDIASEILKSYSATSPSSAAGGAAPGGFETPLANQNPAGLQTPGAGAAPMPNGHTPQQQQQPAVALSMNGGLAITEEAENLSELEKAMRKLVNVDHIDEPAEEQVKLTMKQEEDVQAKKNKNKSVPIPPAAHKRVGAAATLGQISEVKSKSAPKEGIMNAPPQPWHPEAAAAGMLVVHGLQSNAGPPPLQPRGFGVVHGQGSYAYGAQPSMMAPPVAAGGGGAPPQHYQQQAQYAPPPQQAYPQQQQAGYPQYR